MDHMPIISILEIEPEKALQSAKYNYRAMDWNEFRNSLKINLATIQVMEEFKTTEAFQQQIERLDTAIKATIKDQVPVSKPSPYTKRWWTKDLTCMKNIKRD